MFELGIRTKIVADSVGGVRGGGGGMMQGCEGEGDEMPHLGGQLVHHQGLCCREAADR